MFLIILPAPLSDDMTPSPAAPSVGVWALLEGLLLLVARDVGGAWVRGWAGEL